jgi:hypothetical protein
METGQSRCVYQQARAKIKEILSPVSKFLRPLTAPGPILLNSGTGRPAASGKAAGLRGKALLAAGGCYSRCSAGGQPTLARWSGTSLQAIRSPTVDPEAAPPRAVPPRRASFSRRS